MYTKCPECQTMFRLTAQILRQAQGRVRCGGCGSAFNALDNLSEDPPAPDTSDTQVARRFERESQELLEALDELSGGEDVRIEDTGAEWRVVDDDTGEESGNDSGSAELAEAAGADVDDDAAAEDDEQPVPGLRWTFADDADSGDQPAADPERPRDGGADDAGTAAAGEPAAAAAPQTALDFELPGSDDELRFDDNTPLPDDFYSANAPTPRRRASDRSPDEAAQSALPEGERSTHVDLELSDLDWQDLLAEVEASNGGAELLAEIEAGAFGSAAQETDAPETDAEGLQAEAPPAAPDAEALPAAAEDRPAEPVGESAPEDAGDETLQEPAAVSAADEAAAELPEDAAVNAPEAGPEESLEEVAGELAGESEPALSEDAAAELPGEAAEGPPEEAAAELPEEPAENLPEEASAELPEEPAESLPEEEVSAELPEAAAESLPAEVAAELPAEAAQQPPGNDSADAAEDAADDLPEDAAADLPEDTAEYLPAEAADETAAEAPDEAADEVGDDDRTAELEIDRQPAEAADAEASEKEDALSAAPWFENPSLVETIVLEGDTVRDSLSAAKDADEDRSAEQGDVEAEAPDAAEPELEDGQLVTSGASGKRAMTPQQRYAAIAAIVLLGLLLAWQVVHANRESLATLAVFDNTLAPLYAALGSPVTPAWDIRGWQFESTRGSTDETGSRLTIYSRIANRSDGELPFPLVHVSLTDRFDDVIGSRLLEPGEYLAGNANASRPIAAGDDFTAVITVDAPSPDATGFKLNVCYPLAGERVRCAIEDFRD